ncbi:MAG: M15 family metallopeptidase [Firmicutes bacterium]|nr:M15 family metallopeptidase [[Eubacterium] siraeum]MCM1487765.1 M15 family metallopeptidase [Bacillota bacterium]
MNDTNPIPLFKFPDGNYTKSYKDNEMVDITEYFGGKILVEPKYYGQGLPGAENGCKLRLLTAQRLETALQGLPEKLTFKVYDSYRTVETQQALYDSYYGILKSAHNDWSEERLEEETKKFVSKPSLDEENPSVHNTGGAVDLTLYDKEKGRELNMGTEFDDFSPKANTRYFEESADLPRSEEIRSNRRLLYWCMINAGFTNLPTEWWHYDYGDGFWSFYTGKPAIFKGIIKGEKK